MPYNHRWPWLAAAALSLAGCALPQNPRDYMTDMRDNAPRSMVVVDKIELARPQRAVAADAAEYAAKCIEGFEVRTRIQQGMQLNTSRTQWHARVEAGTNGRQVFSVQADNGPAASFLQRRPPGGIYVLVADIATNGSRTTVDLYHGRVGEGPLVAAKLREWVAGNKKNCPDLT